MRLIHTPNFVLVGRPMNHPLNEDFLAVLNHFNKLTADDQRIALDTLEMMKKEPENYRVFQFHN